MEHLLGNNIPNCGIYGIRVLACKAKNYQGTSSNEIPSSMWPNLDLLETANVVQWLLNRETRARYDPSFRQNPQVFYNNYSQGRQFNMENMAPPPLYNPNGQPPVYQGPEGGSKVDPSQWRSGPPTRRPAETGEPAPSYDAPAGPPPTAVYPTHTGATAVGNNSFRA